MEKLRKIIKVIKTQNKCPKLPKTIMKRIKISRNIRRKSIKLKGLKYLIRRKKFRF